MPRASSRPDATPAGNHAAIAERLIASGDPDYRVLQEGYWPDRARRPRRHRPPAPAADGGIAAGHEGRRIAAPRASRARSRTSRRRWCRSCASHSSCRRGSARPARPAPRPPRREARRVADALLAKLPELREQIFDDARAAWRNDPSCRHPIEALYAYPGVFAITRHRIAHILYTLDVPLLPRLVAEDAHRRTGIDINAGATIGREFFIDHGTGVVIGETAVVGDRVTLYQGVTLGAKSFQVDKSTGRLVKGVPRHPIVEDDVTIYASATVLGRITVGRGSIIGGNVWLTHSVPPNSRVSQAAPQQGGFTDGAGI